MCGLFGFSLSPAAMSKAQRGILSYVLARENDSRGGHSWGFASFDRAGYPLVGSNNVSDPHIEKGLGDFAPEAFRLIDFSSLIGHTRFATKGKVIEANAHPFNLETLVGAHNGVLFNHQELDARYSERNCAVDSQHLFHHLEEGLPFSDIEGYGTIEWLKKDEPDKIFLCRLDGGELSVAGIRTKKGNTIGAVWSSDEDDLIEGLKACGLNGNQWFMYEVKEEQVLYATPRGLHLVPNYQLKLAQFKYFSPQNKSGKLFSHKDFAIDKGNNSNSNDGGKIIRSGWDMNDDDDEDGNDKFNDEYEDLMKEYYIQAEKDDSDNIVLLEEDKEAMSNFLRETKENAFADGNWDDWNEYCLADKE